MKTIRICPGCGSPVPADAPGALCPSCLLKSSLAPLSGGDDSPRGASARATPIPGRMFGPYRIIRLLGRGGMGEVYEAEHAQTGRRLALKVMSHALASEEDRKRFLREGRLAAAVNHPNVVYIYGSEEIDGAPVIAMELASGGTLKDEVKRKGQLPPAPAVDAVLQILSGLEAAQRAGVLHRDIKPANCFVDADGVIKVGDFGLSISTLARGESLITAAGSMVGTPAYASPEQLRGQPLDTASDIYSAGATLYHLLTGQTPFVESDFVKLITEVLDKEPPSPGEVCPGIPPELSRIVLRCLAKDRQARYQTYQALREALLPFRAADAAPAPLARRFLAGLLDELVAYGPSLLFLGYWSLDPLDKVIRERTFAATLLWLTFFSWYILYFALLESRHGSALGKLICGLRVVGPDGQKPGFTRALARALIYATPDTLPSFLLMAFMPLARVNEILASGGTLLTDEIWFFPLPFFVLFVTMRKRNGYAAVHDLLTRSRVIVSPKSTLRPLLNQSAFPAPAIQDSPVSSASLGPYQMTGRLWAAAPEELWEAFDPALRRKIWVHFRAATDAPASTARRDLNRPGRLRWLNGGRTDTHVWDAYQACDGAPFLALDDDARNWSAVRLWLLDLAEEISAALRHGGALPILALDRLWITSNGRAVLLDFHSPALEFDAALAAALPLTNVQDFQRFLDLVAEKALGTDGPLRAVPLHARSLLDSLKQASFDGPEFVVGNLQSLASKPGAVTRPWRLASLAVAPAIIVGFAFLIAGMVEFDHFRWERQWRTLYPGQPSLRSAAAFYNEQLGREGRQAGEDAELARVFLVHHFGTLLTNDAFWTNRNLTADLDEKVLRGAVLGHPLPTPEIIKEAEARVAPAVQGQLRLVLSLLFFGMLLAGAGAVSLLEFLGAALLRQSPVLRLFGLAIVDRHGLPASRGRLLWRWAMTWLPLGGLIFIAAGMVIMHSIIQAGVFPIDRPDVARLFSTGSVLAAAVAIVALIAFAALALGSPSRGLPDRLAGTRLVPR